MSDADLIERLYARWGYSGAVTPEAVVLLASVDDETVGVVRLEPEHGVIVLRGMHVEEAYQGRGLGTSLLEAAVEHLDRERVSCYCVPYTQLVEFYGRAGFREIEAAEAPSFLCERLAEYRVRGLEVTLMLRGGAW